MLWNLLLTIQLSTAQPVTVDASMLTKTELLSALETEPSIFVNAPEILRRDHEVIETAVRVFPANVAYVPTDVWTDRQFLLSLFDINVALLRDLPVRSWRKAGCVVLSEGLIGGTDDATSIQR